METKIRNKQTGETLTGEILGEVSIDFLFRISGCAGENGFLASEWEILPPPLPTGIGAVVRDGRGSIFSRAGVGQYPWRLRDSGSAMYSDTEVSENGSPTILSEGVTL